MSELLGPERYYSKSLLRSLAYEDDVNGNCDGTIDFTVIDSIGDANVKKEIFAEWKYDHWCEFKCSNCGNWSNSHPKAREKYCSECGATMINARG